MSFDKLPVAKLREAALDFGIAMTDEEVKSMKKKDILDALSAEGVTYDAYESNQELKEAIKKAEEDDEDIVISATPGKKPDLKAAAEFGDTLLIRMERENFSYEVPSKDKKRTWRFTKEHPFVAMPFDEASDFLSLHSGFRIAAPHEAKEYYDG
jgi:hypothetical protein